MTLAASEARRVVGRGAHALIAALLAGGCGSIPISQLVVMINSDLSVPTELSVVSIKIERPPDASQGFFRQTVDPGEAEADTLPLTVTLRARTDTEREVAVIVGASDRLGVEAMFFQRARAHFTRNEARVLCLHLDRACQLVQCGPSQTCVGGSCVEDDSFDTPLYHDGYRCDPTVMDAGLPDASDASSRDAGEL
jgi:hypothetical protein